MNSYNLLNPNAYYPPPYGGGYMPGQSPYTLSNYGLGSPGSMLTNAIQSTYMPQALPMPQIMPQGLDTSYSGVGLGRNVNIGDYTTSPEDQLKPGQTIEGGEIVGENAPIGILGGLAGLTDATLGLLGIKTDLDQRGTRQPGKVSVAGFGGEAPKEKIDWNAYTNALRVGGRGENIGGAVPTPQEQMERLAFEQRDFNARRPMYQQMLGDARRSNVATYQAMQSAALPFLQWASNQAPAVQSRMAGAFKNQLADRAGAASMMTAAGNVLKQPRAFGRPGTPAALS